MPLEVHHLHLSQSERVVWLLEEMELPYELTVYKRDPISALAPADLKAISPAGTAPYFRDTNVSPPVVLNESAAIVDYILSVYGAQAKAGTAPMARAPGAADHGPYLQWFHYANATLQAGFQQRLFLDLALLDTPAPEGNVFGQVAHRRVEAGLRLVDAHLARNQWFAGDAVSAADVMAMFSTSTCRGFVPVDMSPYPNVLRWMRDVAARPAYRRALEKGDFGMEPMIAPQVRAFTEFAAFGERLEKLKRASENASAST